MTEIEVTLLNVGGINNTPLEYYAGMTDSQSNTMNSLLANAIKNVLPENEAAKQLSKSTTPTPDFYTRKGEGEGKGEGKELMEAYQKAVYELFKKFIQPILNTKSIPPSSIPPNMPAIESRFRASISSEGIFNVENFQPIVESLVQEKDNGGSSLKFLDSNPEIFLTFLTTILDNISNDYQVEDRHWEAETKYLDAAFRKTDSSSATPDSSSAPPGYSFAKRDYFRIGYLFDQFAHLITLYKGIISISDTRPLTQLAKSYKGLSKKIMDDKQTALNTFLSPSNIGNKVVLLNECSTKDEAVNPYNKTGKSNRRHMEEKGGKYSAICCLGESVTLSYEDKCGQIKNILNTTQFSEEGKDTSIAAESAVGLVTVNETKIYFVAIHCNSWMTDENATHRRERAVGIKNVLTKLKTDLPETKIIIGIDTNTGHIQNSESQGNEEKDKTISPVWRILAPEQVNEKPEVTNGESSVNYYTVNQSRSFFQSQIGKAGIKDKKTKDLILGLNIDKFKDLEILKFENDWKVVENMERKDTAPNVTNPFDHYAVRVKIRIGEAPNQA
jgi:hypothetical protein